MKLDNTMQMCGSLCWGLLGDYQGQIEEAYGNTGTDESITVNMSFKIKPVDSETNEVIANISFTKEKIKDQARRVVSEAQMDLPLETGDTDGVPLEQ